MKINHTGEIGGVKTPGDASTAHRAGSRPAAVAAPAGESVRISALAQDPRLSSSALAELADLEVFDAERVSQIKDAISEGRFKINPEAVADSLLASVREMLLLHQKA